jgi:hypothetical protein
VDREACGQKLRSLNTPVFTLSGYTQFLNLALDGRKSLSCGRQKDKLGFGKFIEVLDGLRL